MFLRILAPEVIDQINRWSELKRWERKELGQLLRSIGLTYNEIRAAIPVSKSTLSAWCREIPMPARADLFSGKRGRRAQIGARLHQRALERDAEIRSMGRSEAKAFTTNALWVAGVVAYWAEGDKRSKGLRFSNSDPAMVRLFITWAERFLGLTRDRFTLRLQLHSGLNESESRSFWARETGIASDRFGKTFVKPEGSGHRKNVLHHGTVQVRVSTSTAMKHRVLGWIEGFQIAQDASGGTLARGVSSIGRAADS